MPVLSETGTCWSEPHTGTTEGAVLGTERKISSTQNSTTMLGMQETETASLEQLMTTSTPFRMTAYEPCFTHTGDDYDVVQFYPWFNFYFPLFLCMVMYGSEYKTKENKN